jgi:acyl-CoA thioester hydrolase
MTQALGATWVIRTHHIEYFSPAFAGDAITVLTWVANFRKVRSLRRYKFVRNADRTVLAQGETDWVFVDANSGRPRAIPDEIKNAFVISAEEPAS